MLIFFIRYLYFYFGILLWLWLLKIYHQCTTCSLESVSVSVKEKVSCSRNAQQFEICPILRQRVKLLHTRLTKSAVSVLLPAAVGNPTTSVFSWHCFVSAAPTFAWEWRFSLQYYQEKQKSNAVLVILVPLGCTVVMTMMQTESSSTALLPEGKDIRPCPTTMLGSSGQQLLLDSCSGFSFCTAVLH